MTRYRYDPEKKQVVEVGSDWSDAPRSTGDLGKFEYDNLRASDGADISSRSKRRDYMKARGLADPRDFRESGAKYESERMTRLTGAADSKERRELIGRALHERKKRGR